VTVLLYATLPLAAQKKDNLQKPLAGPRATALRVTWLYIAPDTSSQKVDKVQIGREMVLAEKSGPWMRVYANTDIQEVSEKDAPIFGHDETPPPVSGWMEARGVVVETTPNGDQVLMGEAANQEALANDPRGPAHAAQSARLIYRRLVEMFPNSPLAAEAAWRAGHPVAVTKGRRLDAALGQGKRSLHARPDGRRGDEKGPQVLSPHAAGRPGRI
jgi:hypothetical protein